MSTNSRQLRLGQALEELRADAQQLQQLATTLDDAASELPKDQPPEAFREAALKLERSTIGFAVRLLHIVATADRLLALAELEHEWTLEHPEQSDPRTRIRLLVEKRGAATEAVSHALLAFSGTDAPLPVMELAKQMAAEIVDRISDHAVAKLKAELA